MDPEPRGCVGSTSCRASSTPTCAWSPRPGDSCVRPNVYDVDLYATNGVTLNTAAVAAIHAAGAHAVCYVDAGTWEDFRPDASEYPASVKGLPNGWPGERWLDIRATGVLLPIIDARVAKCAAAGFDAVDFDNVDGYENDTGFPLTAAEQLTFNEDLAAIAHAHGLSAGLKNDTDQLSQLESTFDFAINEQCAQYDECDAYDGWTAAGKAVVEVEYHVRPATLLPQRRPPRARRHRERPGPEGQAVEALSLTAGARSLSMPDAVPRCMGVAGQVAVGPAAIDGRGRPPVPGPVPAPIGTRAATRNRAAVSAEGACGAIGVSP